MSDPAEGVNRVVFGFNRAVDTVVIRPVSLAYREVVPSPVRDRVRDFLSHIRSPVTLANDLLQGNLNRAGNTLTRFWVNTIAGIGGLVDVAGAVGIEKHDEDFGQTLAIWGVGEGSYVMLPLLGPSTVRDTVGMVVDFFLDPAGYILRAEYERVVSYARTGLEVVDTRSRMIQATDDLERNSVDYYAAVRSLYKQRRDALIRNGQVPAGSDIPGRTGQLDN
ncbi:MAG: VacJ family lipoprotein [Alphaproteobacteria bacterium]|nr:VacJ family lipoprotein [Alphaproteobacteria bacterium]